MGTRTPVIVVRVNHRAPQNNMRMRAGTEAPCGDPFDGTAQGARKIQDAQKNQHESHAQFHAEAEARRNRQLEKYDRRAHRKNRKRVA